MQQLINSFGINIYLLVAQIVNFLIILYLLKRFAYKPIMELLEKRRKAIEEGQKNAVRAEKALQEATEKEKEILKKAQNESKKILSDASKQAGEVITEATDAGRKQVDKMITEAKEEIEKARQAGEKELATHVAELALDMLKKSLPSLIDEKEQENVLKKAVEELKK
jgi:F-type H+-transporting ATPase subunit b